MHIAYMSNERPKDDKYAELNAARAANLQQKLIIPLIYAPLLPLSAYQDKYIHPPLNRISHYSSEKKKKKTIETLTDENEPRGPWSTHTKPTEQRHDERKRPVGACQSPRFRAFVSILDPPRAARVADLPRHTPYSILKK